MLEENALNVHLPDEMIRILNKSHGGKNIDEKIRLSLAISLFVEGTVTLERAAELAGKPLANFIDILKSKKINWMEYTQEHLEEDELAIQKYLDGANE